jgi:hypothetical protein
MPQLSSTDRLLVAANGMSDALKHPHPDVPYSQVGDDTLTALAKLAAIFKKLFQKHLAPELIQAPLNAAENKQHLALVEPTLTSPISAAESEVEACFLKCPKWRSTQSHTH